MTCVLSAAEKLKSQLFTACNKFHYVSELQQTAFAQMSCLKKVCKYIYSTEWKHVEQSLYELETKENVKAKTGSNPTVVETVNTLVVESLSSAVHLLLLADPFFLDFFFF